jgi:hypothetical protein
MGAMVNKSAMKKMVFLLDCVLAGLSLVGGSSGLGSGWRGNLAST